MPAPPLERPPRLNLLDRRSVNRAKCAGQAEPSP